MFLNFFQETGWLLFMRILQHIVWASLLYMFSSKDLRVLVYFNLVLATQYLVVVVVTPRIWYIKNPVGLLLRIYWKGNLQCFCVLNGLQADIFLRRTWYREWVKVPDTTKSSQFKGWRWMDDKRRKEEEGKVVLLMAWPSLPKDTAQERRAFNLCTSSVQKQI